MCSPNLLGHGQTHREGRHIGLPLRIGVRGDFQKEIVRLLIIVLIQTQKISLHFIKSPLPPFAKGGIKGLCHFQSEMYLLIEARSRKGVLK